MKKIYLTLMAASLVCAKMQAQLVTWTFDNAGTYNQSTSSATSVSGPVTISYGAGVTNNGAQNVGSCDGTLTAESQGYGTLQDLTDYIEFTLTPASGSAINIGTMQMNCRVVGTGPTAYAVRTSEDNFAANLLSGTGISSSGCGNISMPLNLATTDAITVRIYFYTAGNGTGRLNINSLSVNGFGNLLPVKILAFDVKDQNGQNKLNWKVADENNFSHYNVQRSTNGKDFVTIGKVNGGASADYSFNDANPSAKNYYRLQMIDKNGATSNSKVVVMANKSGAVIISLQPNLVTTTSILNIAVSQAQSLNVFVTDIAGRRTMMGKYNVPAGNSQLSLNMSKFASGTYQLSVQPDQGQAQTMRFVKQ